MEEVGGKPSFATDLWDGFDAIAKTMWICRDGKKDFIAFLEEWNKLMDRYAKDVIKLSQKSFKKDPTRTMDAAFAEMRAAAGKSGYAIQDFGGEVQNDGIKTINEWRNNYKVHFHHLEDGGNAQKKAFAAAQAQCHKAREVYIKRCKEADKLHAEMHQHANDANHSKYLVKYNSAESVARKADNDYKTAVQHLDEVHHNYELEMGNILQDMQDTEVSRFNFMNTQLTKVAQSMLMMSQRLQDTANQLQMAIDGMDCDSDIQSYIQEHKSGKIPPPHEQYEPIEWVGAQTVRASMALTSMPDIPDAQPSYRESVSSVASVSSVGSAQPAQQQQDRNTPKRESVTDDDIYVADYEFEGSGEGEVALVEGDKIQVAVKDSSGWWTGTNQRTGQYGMFPSNYVSKAVASSSASTPVQVQSAVVQEPVQQQQQPPQQQQEEQPPQQQQQQQQEVVVEEQALEQQAQPTEPVAQVIKTVKALFDYAADGEGELSIRVGESLDVLAEYEGWYQGSNSQGEVGLFPANYVE